MFVGPFELPLLRVRRVQVLVDRDKGTEGERWQQRARGMVYWHSDCILYVSNDF